MPGLEEAKRLFKNGVMANDREYGKPFKGELKLADIRGIELSEGAMRRLKAQPGDIIYVADSRWWLGGMLSAHGPALEPRSGDDTHAVIGKEIFDNSGLKPDRPVRVEKLF